MPNKILLLDSDQTTVAWFKGKLENQGFSVDTADLGAVALRKIAAAPPDLLVLDRVLPDIDGIEVIRRVRSDPHSSRIAIIVLSALSRPDVLTACLNAGANRYVVKRPGADVELIAKTRALLSQPKSLSTRRGRIVAFCSAKGGSGTTSLCINTADALIKAHPGADIVVVDMVFPMGTVGTALGFESSKTVAKLSQEKTIDHVMIESYVSHPVRWGFRVLLGAKDPQEAGTLDVTKVQLIFETLQIAHDYILVDLGRTLSRISLPILEMSSNIIIVVTPDIATVKTTRFLIQYLESHGIDRERLVVVNNRTVGRVWTTIEDMAHELGIAPKFTVPYLLEHMTMAINEAVPFIEKFPEDSALMTFNDIARFLYTSIR